MQRFPDKRRARLVLDIADEMGADGDLTQFRDVFHCVRMVRNAIALATQLERIPVHETQRDRAQSSPARRSGSDYGWGAGAKPDGVVAVTLGVAALVSGTGGGVVVVTVCSVACGATGVTAWPGPAKPDGVLALTAGLAKLVVGEVGGVVVVTVCWVA